MSESWRDGRHTSIYHSDGDEVQGDQRLAGKTLLREAGVYFFLPGDSRLVRRSFFDSRFLRSLALPLRKSTAVQWNPVFGGLKRVHLSKLPFEGP